MSDERTCKKCGRTLPVNAFAPGGVNPNGRPFVRYVCRACRNFRQSCRPAIPVTGQRRVCRVCGVGKPLADFPKHSSGGRERVCKDCKTDLRRERRHRLKAEDPAAYAGYLRRVSKNVRRSRLQRVLANAGKTGG